MADTDPNLPQWIVDVHEQTTTTYVVSAATMDEAEAKTPGPEARYVAATPTVHRIVRTRQVAGYLNETFSAENKDGV